MVVPHVHEREGKYVREVIEEAGAKTRTIFPIDNNHPVWQFNEVPRIEISIAKNLDLEVKSSANDFFRTLKLCAGNT